MDRIKYGLQPELSRCWDREPSLPYTSCCSISLAGEPLYFVEAPYHSPTDQVVVFQGVAILPDWHLPESPSDRPRLVKAPRDQVVDTLARLRSFEREFGYCIHSRTAVHGDEPLRADFAERVEMASEMFAVSETDATQPEFRR